MRPALLAIALAAALPGIPGCGRRDDDKLRQAVSDMRRISLKRDYAAAWEYMDSGSREKLSKQLRKFQEMKETDPLFEASWRMFREEWGLSREEVLTFDVRRYFIAILEGLDRVQPELRERQIEEIRGCEIVGIKFDDGSAQVTMRTASGATEIGTLVKEDGGWKCVADVHG